MSAKKKTFRHKLKDERRRLGITQKETAKLLAMSPRTYEDWEGGFSTPAPITQEGALARLTGATPAKSPK